MDDGSLSLWTARRRMTLKQALLLLGTVCAMPACLIAAAVAYEDYALRARQVYQSVVETARAIGSGLEHEQNGVQAGLRMLAAADELRGGDLRGLGGRMLQIMRLQGVDGFVLADGQGRVLLAEGDTQCPARISDTLLAGALREDGLVVSGVLASAVPQRACILMGLPVRLAGRDGHGLYAQIGSGRLSQALQRYPLGEGWVTAVLDKDGRIVARSRDDRRFVGGLAVPALVQATRERAEGTLETLTLEGVPALTAFTHTSAGTVAVGAPAAVLRAGLYRSMSLGLLAGLVVLAAALAVAYILARAITRSVRGLIAPAEALGRGAPVSVAGTAFRETEELGAALVRASRTLARTREQAYHDPLTGLSNRLLFRELAQLTLRAAEREKRPVALLMLDLDGFKGVNDRHGHAAGDRVLTQAGKRMVDTVRGSDVVARLGGDEFAILLPGADAAAAARVATLLIAVLSYPFPDVSPTVSASVGIARYPQDGTALEVLLERADRALYEAKQAGRSCYRGTAQKQDEPGVLPG
ncbi:diguanylate cyclase (GGDEF) domain protein [Bordetella hinzii CA90 BAL1384]|nr:diguanylate cyclase (GGDEF) domain protein [Bordetella hinzii CA90 BAL1384]